jgi:hypothetical protein
MRALCFALIALCSSGPAWGRINSTSVEAWLPSLPPFTHGGHLSRAEHLAEWLPRVHVGMSVAQVVVLLGNPDWGLTPRGKLRWAANPKAGIIRYSAGGSPEGKLGGRVVDFWFNNQAQVERIVDNGVIVAQAPRILLPEPLPHGVWWRR